MAESGAKTLWHTIGLIWVVMSCYGRLGKPKFADVISFLGFRYLSLALKLLTKQCRAIMQGFTSANRNIRQELLSKFVGILRWIYIHTSLTKFFSTYFHFHWHFQLNAPSIWRDVSLTRLYMILLYITKSAVYKTSPT